jgi:antitoxin CcdA
MRMVKHLSDPPRPFRGADEPVRRHIGERPKPGPKRAANVSIDAEILVEAKAMKINLSQTLEDELRKRVQDERVKRFQEEHREAFESYNRFIEKNGIWSKKYRKW